MLFGELTGPSAELKKHPSKTLLFCYGLALGDNFSRNPIYGQIGAET